jgi:glutamate synthase domain-containing protein 2
MFALGCIQSLKCNTNHCPTGIATQVPPPRMGHKPSPHPVHAILKLQFDTLSLTMWRVGCDGVEQNARLMEGLVVADKV